MVRDFHPNTSKWMKGVVIQQLGPVTYTVEVDGKLLKRHVDHLWQWIAPTSSPVPLATDDFVQDNFQYPESSRLTSNETNTEEPVLEEQVTRHYPHRNRRPPDRLTF